MPRDGLQPGDVLGGFRIESLIARGGMGVVYRAEQLALRRTVALKVIAPELARESGFRQRFQREAQMAAQLDHPNVVTVFEAGEADEQLYLAMRLVPGRDLRTIIAHDGALEPERAARLFPQVAHALDAAHAAGLVHRDVKPGNVLVSGEGADEHAYLTDFGLTKEVSSGSGLTRTGQWVGTVDYVAPEQIENHPVDARTDVYALGCVVYHALAGDVPFAGPEVAKVYAHLQTPSPPLPAHLGPCREAVEQVLARAMAKRPEDRYLSAGDLGRALAAGVHHTVVGEPERSVATGAAASGTRPAPGGRPATPIQERVPTTHALSPVPSGEPDPTAPGGGSDRRPRRGLRGLAYAAALVLVAAGGAAGAVLATRSGDDQEPARGPSPAAAKEETSPRRSRESGESGETGGSGEPRESGRTVVRPPQRTVTVQPQPAQPAPEGTFDDYVPSGYIVVLASEPERSAAEAKAATAERFGPVGVFRSDAYPRLRPGYWVTFTGRFADQASAAREAARYRGLGYTDAYVRLVE